MTEEQRKTAIQAMEAAVGAQHVSDDTARYSIDGLRPEFVVLPGTVEELSKTLASASQHELAVAPWGGGTRIGLGNALNRLDAVVDLSRMGQMTQHNPADLTCTVEAGIPVATLQKTLAKHGQFLPVDPPLPGRATIGGTLAVGTGGPLKWQFGSIRDLIIGMKVVQADGTLVKSGGQVVKNVSGYDMARLHVGAIGTLGVIAEVSLRLTPLPQHEVTVIAGFETGRQCHEAARDTFHSHVLPLALVSFNPEARARLEIQGGDSPHLLAVRLAGRPMTLKRQVDECTSLYRRAGAATVVKLDDTESAAVWRQAADFGLDDKTTPLLTARASVPPAEVPGLADALERASENGPLRPAIVSQPGYGTVAVHWFGEDAAVDKLQRARQAVHQADGRMIVERCPIDVKSQLDVWDEVGEPLATMRRMKNQYDPKGVLNPGRFAGRI
jgi:glycolate oxidase FAD binding subunit